MNGGWGNFNGMPVNGLWDFIMKAVSGQRTSGSQDARNRQAGQFNEMTGPSSLRPAPGGANPVLSKLNSQGGVGGSPYGPGDYTGATNPMGGQGNSTYGPQRLSSAAGPPSTPGAGGGAPGGITAALPVTGPSAMLKDKMFNLDDFGGAYRNALRQAGMAPNPFNPASKQMSSRWMAPALSQFMIDVVEGRAGADGQINGDTIQQYLSQYLGGISGRGGISPLTQQGAQQGIGSINALLRRAADIAMGSGIDPTGKSIGELMTAMSGTGAATQLGDRWPALLAIAGLLEDPESMQAMMLGAYGPSLGTGAMRPLSAQMDYMRQNWEDWQGPASYASGGKQTFLDLLTNSMNIPWNQR